MNAQARTHTHTHAHAHTHTQRYSHMDSTCPPACPGCLLACLPAGVHQFARPAMGQKQTSPYGKTSTHTQAWTHASMHACTHGCTQTYTCRHMQTQTQTGTCKHTHTGTRKHTRTHAHAQASLVMQEGTHTEHCLHQCKTNLLAHACVHFLACLQTMIDHIDGSLAQAGTGGKHHAKAPTGP